jgi:Zn-dependent metalloprotease
VLGDGDGSVFNGFYSPDVVAKEFANAVVQVETSLTYAGQSGSLLDALSLVVASMAKQHAARQTASEADWLIGTELFPPRVKARALYSLLDPGSAYDDPMLGKDATVGHFRDYVKTKDDNGGVHVNSGIPARAFALSARALGDHSWKRAGLVWYRVMTSGELKPATTFAAFAEATIAVARRDFDDEVRDAIEDSWHRVGVLKTESSGRARG